MLALAFLLIGGGVLSTYTGLTGQPFVPALRSVLTGGAPATAGKRTAAAGPVSSNIAANAAARDKAVNALIAAAPGAITINSGTRTRAEQQKLYDDYMAGRGPVAAKPGTSKHELGLADDLHFASAAVQKWAHDNAARFGLVFPLPGEPWHVELAGAPVAAVPRARTQPVAAPAHGDWGSTPAPANGGSW